MTVITAKDCDKDYKMDKAYSGRDAKLGSSLSNVHQNIDAAKGYVVMLSEGDSVLQNTPGSMGSRQFKSTKLKCDDVDSGEKVALWDLHNHKPDCYSPNGEKQSCGIIPGISMSVSNLEDDLGGIFHIFDTSTKKCKAVTIEVDNGCTQSDGDPKTQTAYLAVDKIKTLSPCIFTNRKNPITNEICNMPGQRTQQESFATASSSKHCECCVDMPKDPLVKFYYTSIGLLMLFIVMKMTLRK